ncbi:MAG: cytochrome c [Anaerolineae bacterium]|nr:cytochrome c [Anaerolineae bacterium]
MRQVVFQTRPALHLGRNGVLLAMALCVALTLVVGLSAFEQYSSETPSISIEFSRMTLTAINGTLCAVGTASGYVALYNDFGTNTPTPTRTPTNAVAQPTATSTYVADYMATALAALPTSNATATATLRPYTEEDLSYKGDPVRGKKAFETFGKCSSCHDVSTGAKIVGPSLQHIATVGENRMPGFNAEAYLRVSLLNPNAYIVEGYVPGIMPITYQQTLVTAEIEDLIAYMLTLK